MVSVCFVFASDLFERFGLIEWDSKLSEEVEQYTRCWFGCVLCHKNFLNTKIESSHELKARVITEVVFKLYGTENSIYVERKK